MAKAFSEHIESNIWLTEKILNAKFTLQKQGNLYRIEKPVEHYAKTACCLKVPKKQGGKSHSISRKLGLCDKELEIQRDQDALCIPLARQPNGNELKKSKSNVPDSNWQPQTSRKETAQPNVFAGLEGKLPAPLLGSVPHAFDVVGDIIIVEIPAELAAYQTSIGEAAFANSKKRQNRFGQSRRHKRRLPHP